MNEGAKGIEQKYDLVLHDETPALDQIFRENSDGKWSKVYSGPVTDLQLPTDARIDEVTGDSPRTITAVSYWDYSLENGLRAAGLRLRSGSDLILIMPFGAAKVQWPGKVLDVVQLGGDNDRRTGTSFYIFSVKGSQSSNTYIVLNGEYDIPIKIMEGFRAEPFSVVMEGSEIRIAELNNTYNIKQYLDDARMMKNGRERAKLVVPQIPAEVAAIIRDSIAPGREETMAALKAAPSSSAVMNELIAQLDDREPLASMANAEVLASKAIRGMLMREFPRLLELEKSDRVVKTHVDKVVSSLANLWLAHKAVSGTLIHETFIRRLEAAMDKRAKCELSMTTLKGQGSHAASYYRRVALESLNTLYQKLYKR